MNTEQLIDTLCQNVPRVSRHAVVRRILLGLTGGVLVAMLLIIMFLGVRPDLRVATSGFPFWIKWSYSTSLAVGATYAITRVARPQPSSLQPLWVLTAPVLIFAFSGFRELARTPSSDWPALWLGRSWASCPWLVLILSVPMLGGLLWSFRKFAPSHLRAAGALAGVSAGAWAATIYCLHCREPSAIFALTWYTLGILFAAILGAIVGPRLLRW